MDLGATSRADASKQQAKPAASGSKSASGGSSSQAAVTEPRPELVRSPTADFDRLERAVSDLAEQHAQLGRVNTALARTLEEREARIHDLEAQLRESADRRAAIATRLDSLISELDRLDEEAARAPAAAFDEAGGEALSPADQGG